MAVALISAPAATAPLPMPQWFWDDFGASGSIGGTQRIASEMAWEASNLLAALKAYPPDAKIPADERRVTEWWNLWMANCRALERYSTHLSSVPLNPTTPEDYRFYIQLQAGFLNKLIKDYDESWKENGGFGHSPYYDPKAIRIFDAIDRMDTKTGQIGDVPHLCRGLLPNDPDYHIFCGQVPAPHAP